MRNLQEPNSKADNAAPARSGGIVDLQKIHRSFQLGHSAVHALRGIDLNIQQGEMVAIWGPSGSGKSTLMNMIGLIDRPDQGSVKFDGVDVLSLQDNLLSDYRGRQVGFVFQSFNLVPVLSVLENVMLPLQLQLQLQGTALSAATERATELLCRVGLAAHLSFRPDRLSGGQRQRTAIARALVARPKLVIADEPTASLDSENSQIVIELMRSLNRDTGTTFVFATHDPRLLDQVPRTVFVRDGLIEKDTGVALS